MEKNDVKNLLNKAGDAIKKGAAFANEKIQEIDVDALKDLAGKALEKAKETAENLEKDIKDLDVEKAKQSIMEASEKTLKAIKQHSEDKKETSKAVEKVLSKAENRDAILVEDALKIMFLMMCVDSDIDKVEIDQFIELKKEVDTEGTISDDNIRNVCAELEIPKNNPDFIEYVMDGVGDAIHHSKEMGNGTINYRTLLWNLLSIACKDKDYSDNEKKVLRTVTRRLEIPDDIIKEMELAAKTLISIQNEKEYLEKSNQQYSVVKNNLDILNAREEVIFNSVKQLISD